jgi:hypothetical protein
MEHMFLRRALFSGLILSAFALPAAADTVRVDEGVCGSISEHVPDDDVTYRPEGDGNGDSVNLHGDGSLYLANDHEYYLPIDIPLEQLLQIDAGSNLDQLRAAELSVGTVIISNGDLFFNGEQLGSESAHAIAEACSKLQQ